MNPSKLSQRNAVQFLNLQGSSLSNRRVVEHFFFDNVTRQQGRLERLRLNVLGSYRDNWDGRGSLGASPTTIALAKVWIFEISKLASVSRPWMHPHITLSEDGEVVFEWWRSEKKITLYVGPDAVQFIKSWGEDIEDNMEEGEMRRASEFSAIWAWLFS